MQIEGSRHLNAPRALVWEKLNDPATLCACIPRCERFEEVGPGSYEAEARVKIAGFPVSVGGDVRLEVHVPMERYTIHAEGKGRVAGMAKGSADVTLRDTPTGTELAYVLRADAAGRLESLAGGAVSGIGSRIAETFFERFRKEVEG